MTSVNNDSQKLENQLENLGHENQTDQETKYLDNLAEALNQEGVTTEERDLFLAAVAEANETEKRDIKRITKKDLIDLFPKEFQDEVLTLVNGLAPEDKKDLFRVMTALTQTGTAEHPLLDLETALKMIGVNEPTWLSNALSSGTPPPVGTTTPPPVGTTTPPPVGTTTPPTTDEEIDALNLPEAVETLLKNLPPKLKELFIIKMRASEEFLEDLKAAATGDDPVLSVLGVIDTALENKVNLTVDYIKSLNLDDKVEAILLELWNEGVRITTALIDQLMDLPGEALTFISGAISVIGKHIAESEIGKWVDGLIKAMDPRDGGNPVIDGLAYVARTASEALGALADALPDLNDVIADVQEVIRAGIDITSNIIAAIQAGGETAVRLIIAGVNITAETAVFLGKAGKEVLDFLTKIVFGHDGENGNAGLAGLGAGFISGLLGAMAEDEGKHPLINARIYLLEQRKNIGDAAGAIIGVVGSALEELTDSFGIGDGQVIAFLESKGVGQGQIIQLVGQAVFDTFKGIGGVVVGAVKGAANFFDNLDGTKGDGFRPLKNLFGKGKK